MTRAFLVRAFLVCLTIGAMVGGIVFFQSGQIEDAMSATLLIGLSLFLAQLVWWYGYYLFGFDR